MPGLSDALGIVAMGQFADLVSLGARTGARPLAAVAALLTATAGVAGPLAAQAAPDLTRPVTGAEVKCVNGKAMGFDCDKVDLLSFLPPSALGSSGPMEVQGINVTLPGLWGWTDSVTGREYALVGRTDGTAFVDVTDPVNPKYVGNLPLPADAEPSGWREIKTYKGYAFIVADVSDNHGMQIFDLSQLRDVKNAPATFKETAHYDNIGSTHSLWINQQSGYAYPVGVHGAGETCGSGLHMVDIRTPTKPTFAGCYTELRTGGANGDGYVHETLCLDYHGPDKQYQGREICFNSSGGALGIADVTDKQNPKTISIARYPNIGYVHQGWFSEDQRYFFINDEMDEEQGLVSKTRTIVFDLSDLDDPVLAEEFMGTTTASDHNLFIRGQYMYQSDFAAGLRVIDVADPKQPKEVGFFDTFPDGRADKPGYPGSWSNYPFYKQDRVLAVLSVNEGLFMVRFRPN